MPSIAQVIKYEGDNSTFIWKHPCEDFNTQTQLIVHESQQAVFYMNGQLLDVFEGQSLILCKVFTRPPKWYIIKISFWRF